MQQILIQAIYSTAVVWPWLAEMTIRGTALLIFVCVCELLFRNRSAATRHVGWFGGLAGLLLILLFAQALPPLRLLPQWKSSASFAPPIASTIQARAVEPPIDSPVQSLSWPSVLTAVWILGAVTAAFRLSVRIGRTSRALKGAIPITAASEVMLFEQFRRRLRIARNVRLMRSTIDSTPMTVCALQPTVLVPPQSSAWDPSRWQIVLLHELAHVARWDVATDLIARISLVVFWFHPLAHLAFRRMSMEQERACDDLVLDAGIGGQNYAEQLLSLAAFNRRVSSRSLGLAIARQSNLEVRIQAILSEDCQRCRGTVRALLAGMLIALGLAVPAGAIESVEPPVTQRPDSEKTAEFQILGEVDRPGRYSVGPDGVTVLQAIQAAGARRMDAPGLLISYIDQVNGQQVPGMSIAVRKSQQLQALRVTSGQTLIVGHDPMWEKQAAEAQTAQRAAAIRAATSRIDSEKLRDLRVQAEAAQRRMADTQKRLIAIQQRLSATSSSFQTGPSTRRSTP